MTVETQSNTPQTTIEYQHEATKHFVKVVDMQLTAKPPKTDKKTYNELYQRIKSQQSQQMTVYELLQHVTSGKVFQTGKYEYQLTPEQKRDIRELQREANSEAVAYLETIKAKGNKRVSTSLIVIDCDDDGGFYDPMEIIEFSDASGAYFTFSHGLTSEHTFVRQNAYRLIYELDEVVSNDFAEFIEQTLVELLSSEFPKIWMTKGAEIAGTLSKKFIFGSNNKDTYYNPTKILPVADFKEMYRITKDLDALQKLLNKQSQYGYAPTQATEYIEMAKHYAENGQPLSYDQWISVSLGIAYSSKEQGVLSEEDAITALSEFDSNQHERDYYQRIYNSSKPTSNPSTIASLVKLATDSGYKRKAKYRYFNQEEESTQINDKIHPIMVRKQLNQNQVYSILTREDKKILLDSPTGSGKTTATINALKSILVSQKDVVAYCAFPSTALANQVASIHGLGKAFTGNINIRATLNSNKLALGLPLMVGTYDKAGKVTRMLRNDNQKVLLVIDEAQQEVSDYSYRYKAIDEMMSIADQPHVHLLGLTGTPDDLDTTKFDKHYKVIQQYPEKPYKNIDFVMYHDKGEYAQTVSETIFQEYKQGNKVLAFINNKSYINAIRHVLTEKKLRVSVITSEVGNELKSDTYRRLLDEERFPEHVDVILTTSVIAQGVNILNENENYTCLIAPLSMQAEYFDIAQIKQTVHRFRNPYKKVLFLVHIKEGLESERVENKRLFDINSRYKLLVKESEAVQTYLKETFEAELDNYRPALFEKLLGFKSNLVVTREKDELVFSKKDSAGISFQYRRTMQNEKRKEMRLEYDVELSNQFQKFKDEIFTIDHRYLRMRASRDKQKYYSYYPFAFKQAISEGLDMFVNEYEYEDYSTIGDNSFRNLLKKHAKYELKSEQEKANAVEQIFTYQEYGLLLFDYGEYGRVRVEKDPAKSIIASLNKYHAKAVTELIKFADYDNTIRELRIVNRNADVYRLKKELLAVHDIEQFNNNKGHKNGTELVLILLLPKLNTNKIGITNAQIDQVITDVAKKNKFKRDDVKQIYNKYVVFDKDRNEKVRVKRNFRLISLDDIGDSHGFGKEEIKQMYDTISYI